MSLQVEATYENGVLKLSQELPLQEGQQVTVTIHVKGGAAQRLYGIVPWNGTQEEVDRWLNDPDEGMWGNRDAE